MSVGTATAIGLGVTAGTAGASIYGAKKAGDAQEKAADVQATASKEALELQRQMYEQQRKDFEPYRNIGLGALGQLGYGMGIDMPTANAQPVQAPPASSPVEHKVEDRLGQMRGSLENIVGRESNASRLAQTVLDRLPPKGTSANDFLAQRSGSLATIGQPTPIHTPSDGGAPVAMMSPQGRMVYVPAAQVAEAERRGGKRVS